jgi:hypothetical protein
MREWFGLSAGISIAVRVPGKNNYTRSQPIQLGAGPHAMVASSVALGTHRDRAARLSLDPHRPGPAADIAILHQHLFARLEIYRLDLDAAQFAAERTFNLEDHRLSLPDPTVSGQDGLSLADLQAVSRTGPLSVEAFG